MAIDLAFVLSNLFFFFSLFFWLQNLVFGAMRGRTGKLREKEKKERQKKTACVCFNIRALSILVALSVSFWTSQSLETKFQQTWKQSVSKRKLGNKLPF